MKTVYAFIEEQRAAGLWGSCRVVFGSAETLELYARVYRQIEELEPKRGYGYRLWGGYRARRGSDKAYYKAYGSAGILLAVNGNSRDSEDSAWCGGMGCRSGAMDLSEGNTEAKCIISLVRE